MAVMNVAEIKNYIKQRKITYEMLSAQSGIPIGTLKSIFSGRTPNPRLDTMQAIEHALNISGEQFDSGRVNLSVEQEELLDVFDKIGERFGAKGQRNYIDIGKKLLNFEN